MQPRKFTLVSGSTRGLGRDIAEYLRSRQINVFTNSRNPLPNSLNSTSHLIFNSYNRKEVRFALNHTKADSNFCENVVINVGSGAIRIEDIDAQWSQNMETNLFAATTLFEEVVSIFPKIQNVIFVSTLAGSKIMVEPPLQYSVSKSALNVFAKHMAAKYASAGIRINVVAPGNLDFEGSVWDRKRKENPSELESYLNENVPSGRLVPTIQISKLVHFLLTENTDIFGQVIGVDGGQSI